MDKLIEDRLIQLSEQSPKYISRLQNELCPSQRKIYLNYQFTYWYNGQEERIWEDKVHVYAVKDLPFCYDRYKKNVIFKSKLIDLINEEKIYPFILFVNGMAIQWSRITVIKDYDYTYIRIDNVDDKLNLPSSRIKADIVFFPINKNEFIYGEDELLYIDPTDNMYSLDNGLYFNKKFRLILSSTIRYEVIRLRLQISKSSGIYIQGMQLDINDVGDGKLISRDNDIDFMNSTTGILPSNSNILLFNSDGYYQDNSNKCTIYNHGLFGHYRLDKEIISNHDKLLFIYYTKHKKLINYAYKNNLDVNKIRRLLLSNRSETDQIKDDLLKDPNNLYSALLDSLDPNKFDLDVTTDNGYRLGGRDVLKAKSISTVSKYDYSLWNDIFIEQSPIKIRTYLGKDFKKLIPRGKNSVEISRAHSNRIEDYVMVFVNGYLYRYHNAIDYIDNTIYIPVYDINDSDYVELLIFTKCNNYIADINIVENTPVYIHPEYNLDDCFIMNNDSQLNSYDNKILYGEFGPEQYMIDFSYTKENDKYIIHLEDNSLYNRNLKLVPKNRFKYFKYIHKNVQINNVYNSKIVLPSVFNFCNDINRYLVFVNGKKISKKEFTITIMSKYRPFDRLELYLPTILDVDDYVDIFYLPETFKEKNKDIEIDTKGKIKLSTNYPKFYSLSKTTCFLFINGKKIHPYDIIDVDMNTLVANVAKYNSIQNVTILEYIDGSKLLAKYLMDKKYIDSSIRGDIYSTLNKELLPLNVNNGSSSENLNLGYSFSEDDLDNKNLLDGWTIVMNSIKELYKRYVNSNEVDSEYRYIYTLFDSFGDITTEDPDYKRDYAPLKTIIYEIVRDYYINRSKVKTGDIFDYDFEVEDWDKDEQNNYNISMFNHENDKFFDYRD